jgi:hypothetical protein
MNFTHNLINTYTLNSLVLKIICIQNKAIIHDQKLSDFLLFFKLIFDIVIKVRLWRVL